MHLRFPRRRRWRTPRWPRPRRLPSGPLAAYLGLILLVLAGIWTGLPEPGLPEPGLPGAGLDKAPGPDATASLPGSPDLPRLPQAGSGAGSPGEMAPAGEAQPVLGPAPGSPGAGSPRSSLGSGPASAPSAPPIPAGKAPSGAGRDTGSGPWWTSPSAYHVLLQDGIPLLGIYRPNRGPQETSGTAGQGGSLFDTVVWLLGNFQLADPFTILQRQFPALARIEIESTFPGAGRIYGYPLPELANPTPPPEDRSTVPEPHTLQPEVNPLVLVYHTHAQESFRPALGGDAAQSGGGEPFSTDPARTVVRVGAEIAWVLQHDYGIPVRHDTTFYDREGRATAYGRSLVGVQRQLQQFPSLRILVDVHRDSVPRSYTTATIDGQPYARVLLVLGTDRKLPQPHWRVNQAFADDLARVLSRQAPGILRELKDSPEDDDPLTYAKSDRYNQHLSPAAVLIEIGGPENTMAEELRTARAVAAALATLIQAGRYPEMRQAAS